MKRNIHLILSLIFLSSCCNKFPDNGNYSGDIISSYSFGGLYLLCSLDDGEEVVINNEEIYLKFIQDLKSDECNKNIALGEIDSIDFSKHSILIKRTVLTKCNSYTEKEVVFDRKNKRVKYNIYVKSCGFCEDKSTINNVVLVPAIPDDYTVIFELID